MSSDSELSPDPGPAPQARTETIASIGEFALIQRIRAMVEDSSDRPRPLGAPSDLLLGIGDDAALVRPEPGWELALTCDTQVCGRHFDPRWMGAGTIGRRAMTVNLSDIAAMGGEPRYALVSLGLPGSMEVAAVEELYRGILEALKGTAARIIGGDLTSSGPEWFVVITLVGRVEQGRALTRAGARPGDRILVTGSPGRSAAGLAVLRAITEHGAPAHREGPDPSGGKPADEGTARVVPSIASGPLPACHEQIEKFLAGHEWARSLVRAFCEPEARIAAGRRVAKAADRPVTALVDLSDGLIGDLAHICERSGVRARIEAARLPHDPDLEAAASQFGRTRAAWTLGPGDDYELLLTVRPAASDRVANELRVAMGLMVTEIGEILPPAVPQSGGVPSQGAVPPLGGVPADGVASSSGQATPHAAVPPSAGRTPIEGPRIGAGLVDVVGLPPGEHQRGGWDHFRLIQ